MVHYLAFTDCLWLGQFCFFLFIKGFHKQSYALPNTFKPLKPVKYLHYIRSTYIFTTIFILIVYAYRLHELVQLQPNNNVIDFFLNKPYIACFKIMLKKDKYISVF